MSSRKDRRKKRAEAALAARHTEHTEHTEREALDEAPQRTPESLAPAALDVPMPEPARVHATQASVAVGPDSPAAEGRWSPEAFARRARFTRYVLMAAAACVLLAVVGGTRYASHLRADEVAALRAGAVAAAVTPPPAQKPVLAPLPPPAASTEDPAPEPTNVEPAEEIVAPTSADSPMPTGSADDRELARLAKRASHLALERGKVADSIAKGEESIMLDPTDREAWLILGAAYMHNGAANDARRCFQSCLTVGTRGETWQCAAMLR